MDSLRQVRLIEQKNSPKLEKLNLALATSPITAPTGNPLENYVPHTSPLKKDIEVVDESAWNEFVDRTSFKSILIYTASLALGGGALSWITNSMYFTLFISLPAILTGLGLATHKNIINQRKFERLTELTLKYAKAEARVLVFYDFKDMIEQYILRRDEGEFEAVASFYETIFEFLLALKEYQELVFEFENLMSNRDFEDFIRENQDEFEYFYNEGFDFLLSNMEEALEQLRSHIDDAERIRQLERKRTDLIGHYDTIRLRFALLLKRVETEENNDQGVRSSPAEPQPTRPARSSPAERQKAMREIRKLKNANDITKAIRNLRKLEAQHLSDAVIKEQIKAAIAFLIIRQGEKLEKRSDRTRSVHKKKKNPHKKERYGDRKRKGTRRKDRRSSPAEMALPGVAPYHEVDEEIREISRNVWIGSGA